MWLFIVWLVFSIFPPLIVRQKGRTDAWTFFFLSIFLSPVIGIIAALIAKPDVEALEQRELTSGGKKKCSFCAEIIRQEATVCRYCGREVPPAPAPAPSASAATFRCGLCSITSGSREEIADHLHEKHGRNDAAIDSAIDTLDGTKASSVTPASAERPESLDAVTESSWPSSAFLVVVVILVLTFGVVFFSRTAPHSKQRADFTAPPGTEEHYKEICVNLQPGETAEWCKDYK